jgi:hypothetical protein
MALDLESNKNKFLTILKGEIKRPGLDKLIEWLESTDFFEAPYTGQYVLSCKGGLVEHSLNTYRALIELVNKYIDRDPNFLLDLEEGASREKRDKAVEELYESLAICGLLHDICRADCWIVDSKNVKNPTTGQWDKVPYYKWDEKFVYGHGEKSVFILQQFIRLYIEEAQAIRYHSQGRDNTNSSIDSGYYALYEVSLLASVLGTAVNEADNILDKISWNANKPQ